MIKKFKNSIQFTGTDANRFFAAIASDDWLLKQSKSESLSLVMREAVLAELIKRDLLEGNWQI